MIPTLCSIQPYEIKNKNDLINNCYLILIVNNI